MSIALQVVVGLFTLPMVALGLKAMFAPATMLETLAVEPKGAPGLNTVRGLAGGFFLASAVMIAAGLATGDTVWFLALAVLMGVAAVGRVVGIAADGFDKEVVRPTVVEVVMAVVLVAAHFVLGGAA